MTRVITNLPIRIALSAASTIHNGHTTIQKPISAGPLLAPYAGNRKERRAHAARERRQA
jgi:hypothetical protein